MNTSFAKLGNYLQKMAKKIQIFTFYQLFYITSKIFAFCGRPKEFFIVSVIEFLADIVLNCF